ncbi:MAG: hypothetical protein JXA99_14095 [Candidatus Lokiarchaeota archaeon]|nr:hypothetical protein [Candidatus Lokiarchaeota archaeon]
MNDLKQTKDNKNKTYNCKNFLQWSRLKWLIITIPLIIFIFRAIQLFIIGDPGSIIQIIGITWGWVILTSEFLFSIIALIGCLLLLIKDLKIQYRKSLIFLILIFFILAFTIHITRLIHYFGSIY